MGRSTSFMAPRLSLQHIGRGRIGGGSDRRRRPPLLQLPLDMPQEQRPAGERETWVSEESEGDDEQEEEEFDESASRERDEWLERRASIYEIMDSASESEDDFPPEFLPLFRREGDDYLDSLDTSSGSSSSSSSSSGSVDGGRLLLVQRRVTLLRSALHDDDDDDCTYDEAEGEKIAKRRRRRRKTQRAAAAGKEGDKHCRAGGRVAPISTCRGSDEEEEAQEKQEEEDGEEEEEEEEEEEMAEGTHDEGWAEGSDGDSRLDDDDSTTEDEDDEEEGDLWQQREEEARWLRWQEEALCDRSDAWGRGASDSFARDQEQLVTIARSGNGSSSPSKQQQQQQNNSPHTPCKSPFSDGTAPTTFGSPFFTSDETDEERGGSRRRQRRRRVTFRQTDDVCFLPAFGERYPGGAAAHVWWTPKELQSFGMDAAREYYQMKQQQQQQQQRCQQR